MDTPDLNLDEVLIDTVVAAVQTALERIGDDPAGRLKLFRRLLALAEEGAVRRPLS